MPYIQEKDTAQRIILLLSAPRRVIILLETSWLRVLITCRQRGRQSTSLSIDSLAQMPLWTTRLDTEKTSINRGDIAHLAILAHVDNSWISSPAVHPRNLC
jgi:hypothetical protein